MIHPKLRFSDFEKIVFFTGAGISAESGVPTYRGPGGIWKSYNYEEYACQEAFERDPERVWEFHNYRRGLVAKCAPNPAHEVIAKLAEHKDVTVVTQNIDGLHGLAGSKVVHELHGSLWKVRCDHCGNRDHVRGPLEDVRCGACHHYWRPSIVWFGDALDLEVVHAAQRAIQACDLIVSIGTSAVVYPAAAFPLVAKEAGATCVEVNPEPTQLSDIYDECVRAKASEAITAMAEGLV